jgi:hypothetical protein
VSSVEEQQGKVVRFVEDISVVLRLSQIENRKDSREESRPDEMPPPFVPRTIPLQAGWRQIAKENISEEVAITVASLHGSAWVGVALVQPRGLRRGHREAAARRVSSLTACTIHSVGITSRRHGAVTHGTRSTKRDLSTGLVGRRVLTAARVRDAAGIMGLNLGLQATSIGC